MDDIQIKHYLKLVERKNIGTTFSMKSRDSN